METFRFLQKSTRAHKLKQSWATAQPLALTEGGSLEPLSSTTFKVKSKELRAGNKYVGLGCLTSLSNEFSLPELRFDETQIEALGRKLWTTNLGASRETTPGSPGDNFWCDNYVLFPAAWPDKCNLPIAVRDLNELPCKFRLLALDEVVASFWLMVGKAAEIKDKTAGLLYVIP